MQTGSKTTRGVDAQIEAAATIPVRRLADHIDALGLVPCGVAEEYRYAALPLCVIDAVFSVGVQYGTTAATVTRFCERAGWPRLAPARETRGAGSHSLTDLLTAYDGLAPDAAAADLFGNRQRTSSRSGILKAEAVRLFSEALVESGIDCFLDITKARLECAEVLILALPGQSSGIAFDYFRMLAGDDALIKPDRMIQRFVAGALGMSQVPPPRHAALLVKFAARELNRRSRDWTPLHLDYAIWRYQRQHAVTRKSRKRGSNCASF